MLGAVIFVLYTFPVVGHLEKYIDDLCLWTYLLLTHVSHLTRTASYYYRIYNSMTDRKRVILIVFFACFVQFFVKKKMSTIVNECSVDQL